MRFYTHCFQYGNNILTRYIDENGKHKQSKVPFSPSVWTNTGKGTTEYKTLDGRPAYRIDLGSINEAKEFVETYKEVEGFQIHGQTNWLYQYMWETYPRDIQWDYEKIRVMSIDIETESENGFPSVELANEKLLLITCQDFHSKQIITFGTKPYTGGKAEHYVRCADETDMARKFLDFWKMRYPDVVTGWNVQFFDIPYLYRRMERLLGADQCKHFSPWGIVHDREITVRGNKEFTYDFKGISVLDYLDLYKKYTYTMQESYKLDNIASVELGENKLEMPCDTFKEFYDDHWDTFVEYNIHDVRLIDMLEEKMKLIELMLTMAYNAKVNYTDCFGQVKMWDMLIHNHLREDNIVIPPQTSSSKHSQFVGAYVKEPQVGQHSWVVSYDLNSLYPHLIMQYNISPETLTVPKVPQPNDVDFYLKSENPVDQDNGDYSIAANGSAYRKDFKGVFPQIMEDIYRERKEAKREMLKAQSRYEQTKDPELLKVISKYNNLQMAMKIALNSAYGAMGNQYFRYFDIRMAEAITTSGQLSIRWIHDRVNDWMNNVLKTEGKDFIIAVDTDSIYVTYDKLVKKVFGDNPDNDKVVAFLDQISKEKMVPFMSEQYEILAKRQNAYDNKMVMEREVIADKGIWTAKKRYVLNVFNSEGVQYAKPKLKIMGLEMIKSSTPLAIRTALKDSVPVILSGSKVALMEYINEYRSKFDKLSVEEISFPRSVNNLREYSDSASIYRKGTPIHVRGSLLYNFHLKQKNLTRKYSAIKEGEKIKFVYLRKPNHIQEDTIAFLSELPKELDLHRYVNYDMMFEKVFLEPLQGIVEPLGWNIKDNHATLEDFF